MSLTSHGIYIHGIITDNSPMVRGGDTWPASGLRSVTLPT